MNGRSRAALAVASLVLLQTGCGGAEEPAETTPTVAQQVPTGQLPDGTRPTRYRLSLTIIPEEDRFSGTAAIGVELDEPSATIWMHGQDLDVTSIYASHSTARIPATWKQQTGDGVVRVDLQEPLPAGKSTLHVEYSAGFDAPLRGLYRVESSGIAYAFTQFESISARLAFPCFDEPRFKTPFELTLTIPASQFAAANTPVERTIELPDGLHRISFMPTLPLPTYLVAWAVGPLDVVIGPAVGPHAGRALPIPLRGIAAKGQGARLQHALERTGKFVLALEDYFGIPYPYRKLDLVAVPDFAAGAMENVGLITFREWLLLLDEQRATEGQRRAFAYVLAHELAHQWFGNLVTMPWWDDIWLNEAFATWMGNKVTQELHPEYRVELGELVSAQRAMRLDSLSSARSIRQPIETNHDIKNAFDSITYEKGGAVLAMFERWMGADTFREGIRLYLRRHVGGTATSADLLAALDEVSEREVTRPFLSFLNQPGVPLVTGTADASCNGGARTLQLSQERYLPVGSSGDPNRIWDIPLCIRHGAGTTCASLSGAKGEIELPGCPSWWMPNADGAGYFRFSMSAVDWTRLRTRGFRELSDRGRIAVADSLEASFDRGVMGIEALLPWFADWVASPLRQLAVAPMRPLRFLIDDASPPALRRSVMSYAGKLYRQRYRQLGWRSRSTDSSDTKLLREAVIQFMVLDVRNRSARARAARLGRAYVGYRSKPNPTVVDAQLAGLVLVTAVQEGDEALFDHLLGLLESSSDATGRSRILSALGNAETPELSARALDLALDPRLRVNEIDHVLRAQFNNSRTRDRAWRWFTENFDALASRFGSGELGTSPWRAASFCSTKAAAEVERFFSPRVAELSGGPRNLAGAVEAISLCAEKASVHMPGVEQAFGSR
ncbi:MAG: M1 family metallopeptidase [Polyangiales bacterium]